MFANIFCTVTDRTVLAWPQENCAKGRDTRDDSRNANEPRDDGRSGEKFLRSNDNRDDYHHEWIHDSKSDLPGVQAQQSFDAPLYWS